MAQLSINETTTFSWTFEQDVANYAAAGIRAMGVWRQKISDYGEEKAVELLAEYGMAVSNLLWAGGFTGSDDRTFGESLRDAADAIQLAGAMRARCLVVYSGARAGHTTNHARRLLTAALQELEPIASEHGVSLALEPMHSACSAEWTFLTNLDDALAVIDAAGPHVKIVFDTYHLCQDRSVLQRIPALVEHISVVHLADSRDAARPDQNRCPLGQGVLPLRETIAALLGAGYDGYFDVELFGEDIEASDNHQLLAQAKQVFAKWTEGAGR